MVTMLVLVFALLITACEVRAQVPLGTAFTYQGFLRELRAGQPAPADGQYDFEFELHDDPSADQQVGPTLSADDANVIDGYFTLELDFGNVFDGNRLWLQTAVRNGASTDPCDFVTLSPRLEVTLTPYAIYAKTAGRVPSGITGNGTTGRIAQFTGPNTIGDSVITQSGGNIGIGVGNPGERLDVGGILRIVAANPSILLYDVNGPWDDRHLMIRTSNQDLSFMSLRESMALEQQLMVIKGTGNVGIGTTNPSETLHVGGSVRIADGSEGQGKVLTSDSNGVASWQASTCSCVPSGAIVMWSGSIASIPSGWTLCDGANGTPDLRDRFIVGASQDDASVAKTNITGSLTQTGGNASHGHSGATASDTSGDYRAWNAPPGTSGWNGDASRGWHTHTLTGGQSESLPPYYALAYVMKL